MALSNYVYIRPYVQWETLVQQVRVSAADECHVGYGTIAIDEGRVRSGK